MRIFWLFLEFSDQSRRRRLAMFYMAARKIPDVRIPAPIGRAMAEEHRVADDQQTGHDVINVLDSAITHS
jgi:hypothetical protein